MIRIYEVWKVYALFVVGAFMEYSRRTEHLPAPVSVGLLLLPLLGADWFLPHWVALSLYLLLLLPLVWLLASIFFILRVGRSRQD